MGWGTKGEHVGGVCRGVERWSGVGIECYNKTGRSIEGWETSCGPGDVAGKVFSVQACDLSSDHLHQSQAWWCAAVIPVWRGAWGRGRWVLQAG